MRCTFKKLAITIFINNFRIERGGSKYENSYCPTGAITLEENVSGEWFISDTKYGPLIHAKLGIAEKNSGKLVSQVRQTAKEIAEKKEMDYVIIDGPPGIGCPVIASITGVDLAVIVTEPTLSGIHDMERVARVSKHFNVPTKIVINKFDINPANSEKIEKLCEKQEIELIAKIPFSRKVSESIVQGMPLVEYCTNRLVHTIFSLWERIK